MRPKDREFLAQWVYRQSGNVLPASPGMPFVARVEALAHEVAMTVEELLDVVREGLHPQLDIRLMEVVLNSETLFFRNMPCFAGLQDAVLPRLIEARRSERRLRIWSGACSTGQEVYSLLILLAEHFPELASWQLDVLATDISPSRIRRATRGRYSQHEVNRGLPARYLIRYFSKQDNEWVVSPALVQKVTFKVQNLLAPRQVTGLFDLILLRHVLIYFDDQQRAQILRSTHQKLRQNGFLLLGSAETPRPVADLYRAASPYIAGCFSASRETR